MPFTDCDGCLCIVLIICGNASFQLSQRSAPLKLKLCHQGSCEPRRPLWGQGVLSQWRRLRASTDVQVTSAPQQFQGQGLISYQWFLTYLMLWSFNACLHSCGDLKPQWLLKSFISSFSGLLYLCLVFGCWSLNLLPLVAGWHLSGDSWAGHQYEQQLMSGAEYH